MFLHGCVLGERVTTLLFILPLTVCARRCGCVCVSARRVIPYGDDANRAQEGVLVEEETKVSIGRGGKVLAVCKPMETRESLEGETFWSVGFFRVIANKRSLLSSSSFNFIFVFQVKAKKE